MISPKYHLFGEEGGIVLYMANITKVTIYPKGNNDELIWKVIKSDCIGETEVVVPESRECILYKDGQMLETLQPGKHTVNVPEYKGVGPFRKIVSEPFECKAYFVKKGGMKRVDWGTPNRMKIIDPFCQYPISIGLHGSFNVTINNSRKFVAKLVGDNESFDTERLMDELSFAFVSEVKGLLANAMKSNGIGSYDIDANLPVLSREIGNYVRNMFDEYGVYVDKFVIAAAYIPDEERAELEQLMKKRRLLEMQQDNVFTTEKAARMEEYRQQADTAYRFASLDADVAKEVAASINRAAQPVQSGQVSFCARCGNVIHNGDLFCPKCGAKIN